MDGFISFTVDQDGLQILRKWGVLTQMKKNEDGVFDIDLEHAVTHYQITVANDAPAPITHTVLERGPDNFLLRLSQNGEPYNPGVRCTVSVDLVPSE